VKISQVKKRYFKPGDAFVGVVWLLLLGLSFGFFKLGRTQGEQMVVSVDNQVVACYSLKQDQDGFVDGPLGRTHFSIRHGQVFITEAPCPQKHCQHFGAISHSGEAVFCVPNRVVIQVEGKSKSDLDAITM
jgi:hypothetical protein